VAEPGVISELSASLMNTARQDWMTLENLHTEMPLTDDFARPPLPAFGSRVRCRSIYDAAAMENPVARRIIEACADAGEQARVLPRAPMKMKLADRATAMLPLTPAGTAGALIIRAPVIIAALREYFELLWDRATPLTGPQPPSETGRLTPAQQRVLELMAVGLQDGAIASRAGISITTVRRHITVILTRLGVSSMFAAGAAAQRRGWIGQGPVMPKDRRARASTAAAERAPADGGRCGAAAPRRPPTAPRPGRSRRRRPGTWADAGSSRAGSLQSAGRARSRRKDLLRPGHVAGIERSNLEVARDRRAGAGTTCAE
jgi:DNA-binding CsgD family transcriptional regulator